MDIRALIDALSDPAVYPGEPGPVEVRETHASAVFLTADDAYKLKKPVNFGFLNYSTLARRRRMCGREVALNRRLAPGVYLGVERLTLDRGRLRIGGRGMVIDYLVHMRRLPDDRMLASLVARDEATATDVRAVARRIAAFHAAAARGPQTDHFGQPRTIRRNVEENFEQAGPLDGGLISAPAYAEITGFSRAFLREERQTFLARIAAGKIRDCHGDLRTDHVYLVNGVDIIDCIEFNQRFRYEDVAADIAFLAMDLDAHGAPDLADALLDEYGTVSGDEPGQVLDFYRCYRAYTRAKVACIRARVAGTGDATRGNARIEARRYFHLALRYARHDRQPRLILMSGLTGTGKSTLATPLGEVLAAKVMSSDETRKRLAGLGRSAHVFEEPAAGLYAPEVTARVYRALADAARCQLARGRSAVLDATYLRRADREAARRLASEFGARFLAVECTLDEDATRERIEQRTRAGDSWSDGRWPIYLHQKEAREPLDDLPATERVTVDTAAPIDAQIEAVIARLEEPEAAVGGPG